MGKLSPRRRPAYLCSSYTRSHSVLGLNFSVLRVTTFCLPAEVRLSTCSPPISHAFQTAKGPGWNLLWSFLRMTWVALRSRISQFPSYLSLRGVRVTSKEPSVLLISRLVLRRRGDFSPSHLVFSTFRAKSESEQTGKS